MGDVAGGLEKSQNEMLQSGALKLEALQNKTSQGGIGMGGIAGRMSKNYKIRHCRGASQQQAEEVLSYSILIAIWLNSNFNCGFIQLIPMTQNKFIWWNSNQHT